MGKLGAKALLVALVLSAGAGGVQADEPGVDENWQACSTADGNLLTGDHPFASGHVGDEEEPPYVPYSIDAYLSVGETWACVQAGDTEARAVAPAGTTVVDAEWQACTTTPGNRMPGPFPHSGAFFDEDEEVPPWTPFLFDVYVGDSQTWLCARLGDAGYRVVLPAGSTAFDTNWDACTTAPGNRVPGPHPAMGDVDAFMDDDETWLCVGGEAGVRLLLPAGTTRIDRDANGCAAEPIASGHVGDEEEPPYAPYLVAANEAGMVCLQAGEYAMRLLLA